MTATSRAGERGSITIQFQLQYSMLIANDSAISEFSMEFRLFELPYGSAKVVADVDMANAITSDTRGIVYLSGFDGYDNEVAYNIHITAASRTLIGGNKVALEISFLFGDRSLYANMSAFADEGSSLDVVKRIISRNGVEYDDRMSMNSIKPQDTQVWRLVEASLMDNLTSVIDHSNCPGDFMFWCMDEESGKIRISSIEAERGTSNEKLLIHSPQAASVNSVARQTIETPTCTCWSYLGYIPLDSNGMSMADRSPNFMIDSFDANGKKDMGSCTSECWTGILDAFGVPYEDTAGTQTFGGKDLIRPFPNNTHKSYSVAPYVRGALIATYCKVVETNLYNTLGPKLGDMIKFVAKPITQAVGDVSPDGYYTDEYLIIGKRICKNAMVAKGLLGDSSGANTTDVITYLSLASNHTDSTESSVYYKDAIAVQDKFNEVKANG